MPLKFACHTITWGWEPFKDHGKKMLTEIKEAGYDGVEFNPVHVSDIDAVKRIARDIGLEIMGISAGDPKKGIDFAYKLGAYAYVVGGPTFDTMGKEKAEESDYLKLSEELNSLVEFSRNNQIIVTLHPHLWTIVLTEYDLETILAHVQGLKLCPDIAHLKAGGTDPVHVIEKYRDRLWGVHLKDLFISGYSTDKSGPLKLEKLSKDDKFVELGKGNAGIDIKKLMDTLKDTGYNGWVTVELDSTYRTPFESAKSNREFLRSIGY